MKRPPTPDGESEGRGPFANGMAAAGLVSHRGGA